MASESRKKEFFENFFKGLPNTSTTEIQYKFNERNYEHGQTLFKEGDPITNLFILSSGTLSLSKWVSTWAHKLSKKGKTPNNDATRDPELDADPLNKSNLKRNLGPLMKENIMTKPKPKIIASVVPPNFLGDDELKRRLTRWAYTATVTSQKAKVYYIIPENLLLLRSSFSSMWGEMMGVAHKKNAKRVEAIKNVVSMKDMFKVDLESNRPSQIVNLGKSVDNWKENNKLVTVGLSDKLANRKGVRSDVEGMERTMLNTKNTRAKHSQFDFDRTPDLELNSRKARSVAIEEFEKSHEGKGVGLGRVDSEKKSKFSERKSRGEGGGPSWGGGLSIDKKKEMGNSQVLGRNASVPELSFQARILEQQS
jgi:hypothetical protein